MGNISGHGRIERKRKLRRIERRGSKMVVSVSLEERLAFWMGEGLASWVDEG